MASLNCAHMSQDSWPSEAADRLCSHRASAPSPTGVFLTPFGLVDPTSHHVTPFRNEPDGASGRAEARYDLNHPSFDFLTVRCEMSWPVIIGADCDNLGHSVFAV